MQSIKFILGFTLLFGSIFTLISFNEATIFKLTNAVCESYNKSWLIIPTCRLKAVKRDRALFNLNVTILHPVNDIVFHMRVLKKANGYKPWVLNTKVNLCQYMRRSNNPTARIFFQLTKEFSNINHSCPYSGPTLIQNFYPKPELLRLPFPTGDYILTFRWFFDQKLQGDVNVSFSYVEDLLKQ